MSTSGPGQADIIEIELNLAQDRLTSSLFSQLTAKNIYLKKSMISYVYHRSNVLKKEFVHFRRTLILKNAILLHISCEF